MKVGLVALWAGCAAAAGLAVLVSIPDPFADARAVYSDALTLGMTEAEVRLRLGEPTREYSAGSAPQDYYVSGYSRRKRAITGKVLIYVGGEPICYVWIDREGSVEDYFVGGS